MGESEMLGRLSELKSLIGVETRRTVIHIEKVLISKIVEAIGDPNPLWEQLAPPGFLCAHMMSSPNRGETATPSTGRLDGGGEWEYIKPIKVGDTITSATKLVEAREHEGKRGKMIFTHFETTHTNQEGEQVAVSRANIFLY